MSLGPSSSSASCCLYLPAVLPTTLRTIAVPFQHCFSVLHLQPLPDVPCECRAGAEMSLQPHQGRLCLLCRYCQKLNRHFGNVRDSIVSSSEDILVPLYPSVAQSSLNNASVEESCAG